MFNFGDMLGRMSDVQNKIKAAQAELAHKTVTAEVAGGLVRVTANGLQRITAIEIDPICIDPNEKTMLEDIILSGINQALEDASEMGKQEMAKQAKSFLPPGVDPSMFGL